MIRLIRHLFALVALLCAAFGLHAADEPLPVEQAFRATARAIDDHTVEFKLKEPFPAFIQAFEVSSAPMVPAHIYEGTDYRANPANNTPIGTGPFKLKEWVKGSYIQLVRN